MAGAVLLAAAVVLSACAATPSPAAPSDAPAAETPITASPLPSAAPAGDLGPVESFLAWLEASRAPDAEAACAGLSPELAARMIAELNGSGAFAVSTCAEMITATAELYRATAQSSEVDVTIQEQTENDATLFVTYLASGDCGTVVMTREVTGWIITERSEECAV